MSLAKITNEATQRIAAHFKPNTFFLHTNKALPAIVVMMPNRGERSLPLMRLMKGLADQEGFDFMEKLKGVKISKEESKQRKDTVEAKLTSVCGLTFDERTTFIASNQEGELILAKQIINPSQVLAVILYSSVEQSPVKALHTRNYQNLLLFLRFSATLSILLVLRELLNSTRLQNHPSTP